MTPSASKPAAAESAPQAVVQLPLARIEPNPLQPRRSFDEGRIRQLADSIAHQGVIQPLVVRPHPEGESRFELIAGERRLRAMRVLGWPTAPALVRAVADGELLETSLVENLQREALTPIEEAQALRDLLERHGYTQETLARRIGRDRSTIANLIRLLALPVPIQEDLEAGRLSAGHARALLAVPDTVMQIALRNEVLRRGLSVRETERWVRRQREGAREPAAAGEAERPAGSDAPGPPPAHRALIQALERRFATRVNIRPRTQPAGSGAARGPESGRESGAIELEYFSPDDLDRLYQLLMGRGK